MSIESGETGSRSSRYFRWLLDRSGLAFVAAALFVIFLTFEPVIKEELRYTFSHRAAPVPVMTEDEVVSLPIGAGAIVPVDEQSGIVIPKIGANARVIEDVDWTDSAVYQRALAEGVAQAAGTSHAGEPGNTFLFAHSGGDFYQAARYNAVFYLLGKLSVGDDIYLFRNGEKYAYRVTDSKIVSPDQVEYLEGDSARETLTLMTCWPAGTTYKRLIVLAERVSE